MVNNKDIGSRIKAIRNEKGLTQERLVEIIGEDILSLSTYKRIEDGTSPVNLKRLYHISRALDCKPTDLFNDVDYLREAIMACYEANGDKLDEDELKNIDYGLIDMQISYPEIPDHPLYTKFKITNLMQFIIYLPLMDPLAVMNSLYGIDGDTFEREYYVLEKLAYLYGTIPDGDAKRYADMMASQCSADYYMDYHRTSGMTKLNKYMADQDNWDEIFKIHNAYRDVIEGYRTKIQAAHVIFT